MIAFAGDAQLIGELDDQDAVFRDQPDERDQPDLAIDVQRPPDNVSASSAPAIANGTLNMMTKGATKLSNCAASTRHRKAVAREGKC